MTRMNMKSCRSHEIEWAERADKDAVLLV